MRWLCVLGLLAGCGPTPCERGLRGLGWLVAGTGALRFNRDGPPAGDSALSLPSEARRGPDGRLYLMDFNNHRLRVIDEAGRLQTIAGDGFPAIPTLGVAHT